MKYRSKETIEAVGFQELVEIALATEGANIVNGVPWAFEYKGANATHETDDLYLISGKEPGGGLFSIKFERGDFLVTGSDGELFTLSPETLADNYAPVEAPRVVDADLDDNPRIPEIWSREDVARELRAARRRCSEIQMENRRLRDAYRNMRDFAEANGLNTTTAREDEDPDGNPYVITPESELEAIKKALEPFSFNDEPSPSFDEQDDMDRDSY